MAKLSIDFHITKRYWCSAMLGAGALVIRLGVDIDKVCACIVKYGFKIEVT